LPPHTLQLVVEEAKERKLVEVLAPTGSGSFAELRYRLSEKGKQWALQALAQSQYIGPAPVSHAAYVDRIQRQHITNERIDHAAIDQAFDNLVISEELVYKIGPALNSGQSILLYGPPGNGKTSVAERIGEIFTELIYVPYCFEVGGQIITVFDPSIHKRAESKDMTLPRNGGHL
jgi:predicted ATPase with chaperone activity